MNSFLRLQKANNHLDEASAKLLIERALIKDENGNYTFSRDIYVKISVRKILISSIMILKRLIFENMKDVITRPLY